MAVGYFNNVVKKILKLKGKIIGSSKIKLLVESVMDENYSEKKTYKIIYYLKSRGYLVSLKKDIFYVKDPEEKFNENDIIDQFYWEILKDHCETYLGKNRYIAGAKALELNSSDLSIPENIDIINPAKQSREVVLATKYVNFKKYSSGELDLYKKLKKYTHKLKVDKYNLNISNIELSILESLYNPLLVSQRYIEELVKKILRKYKKTLNFEDIIAIIRLGKHHSSINRLYKICKGIDADLADKIAEIIKKYSFFIDV